MFLSASRDRTIAADWSKREFAKFRLLPNPPAVDNSAKVLIGLEINLASGWQFYSKNPGAYGIAPKFDWSPSRNLSSASVHWPEPTPYVYSTKPPVSTLGYKGSVLLPIVLEAEKVGRGFDLRLILEYAVCEDYCVIDTVDVRLGLPAGRGKASPHSERLKQALTDASAGTW